MNIIVCNLCKQPASNFQLSLIAGNVATIVDVVASDPANADFHVCPPCLVKAIVEMATRPPKVAEADGRTN